MVESQAHKNRSPVNNSRERITTRIEPAIGVERREIPSEHDGDG